MPWPPSALITLIVNQNGIAMIAYEYLTVFVAIHLNIMQCCFKSKITIKVIQCLFLRCALHYILHSFYSKNRQLTCSSQIRCTRHITGKACSSLAAIGEKQYLSSLIRKMRFVFLSFDRLFRVELRLNQVEERQIATGSERSKLCVAHTFFTVRACRECDDIRPSFFTVSTVVKL